MFGNIAGLYPRTNQVKVQYLGEKAIENNSVIVALTESHLKSQILDAEIQIPGYQLFRQDRMDRIKRGGVITYVKNEYASGLEVLTSGDNGVVEWKCLMVPIIGAVFINIYRPPTCGEQPFKSAMNDIAEAVNKLKAPMPTIIMSGDFNMPFVDWGRSAICGGTLEMQRQAGLLMEFVSAYCLSQVVSEPTRKNNILDLLFVNNPEIIWKIDIDDTVVSDHKLLLARTRIPDGMKNPEVYPELHGFSRLNFFSEMVDWEKLNRIFLEIDWESEFDAKSVSEILDVLQERLLEECEKQIPRKGAYRKKSNVPRDRRIMMRKRAKLNKKLARVYKPERRRMQRQLELLEFQMLESHRREARENERRAVEKIKENPKYFFKYAKKKSCLSVPVGPFEEFGTIISEPREMSEMLQRQFVKVFSQPKLSDQEVNSLLDKNCLGFTDISVERSDIMEAIQQISPSAAPGPDGIPPLLLKNCSTALSLPLSLLWRKSLATGEISDQLKLGLIIPIFKNGARSEPKNYRPVTLTSHLIKIFERVLIKNLVKYLENNDLLNDGQHGFRKGRSCLSQLMDHYQSLLNIMETGEAADVIYLDFAKAFDKVDHGILIRKLTGLGVGGSVLCWIYAFLKGRLQTVKVEGSLSCSASVVSGVPQGTVLGPILFLLFIGDIDRDLQFARATSFADDTRVVMQVGDDTDAADLQGDLGTLYKWAEANNMKFNGSKFQYLRYGPGSLGGLHYLTEEGEKIEEATALKDLGIMMSASGTFENHISEICQKGSNMVGWILRTVSTRNSVPMLTLFNAVVRPVLEYCSQLWSPKAQGLIRKIETIQRQFTAKISGTEELCYSERLKHLRMYSLERRRDRYMVIYVWKVIQGHAPNLLGRDKVVSTNANPRLGRYCLLPPLNKKAPNYVQTLRENSFSVYGPKLFNELPTELRNFDGSLASFKCRLDKFLSTVEDQPYDPSKLKLADSNNLRDQIRCARSKVMHMLR